MTIASAANTASSVTDNLSITKRQDTKKNNNELGQAAFLELMITQMNNQNPLNPQDNSEFVAQLAQFSSVEGLERLNKNFTSFMSNNALQASSLVGRNVSVNTDSALLQKGTLVSGEFNADFPASSVTMAIYDDSGSVIQKIPIEGVFKGENKFRWDGQHIELNGKMLDWKPENAGAPIGTYRFEVTASRNGKEEALKTTLSANVNSVSLGDDGEIILNLAGIGSFNVDEVRKFN